MDKYGYIGIETLLDFCENSKDHAITPNDFMRMNRVKEPPRIRGKWIRNGSWSEGVGMGESYGHYWKCDKCGYLEKGD